MSDHKLSLELPYFHEDANVYAICYVRDPIERFISRYFFHRHFEEVACIAQRMTFRDFANAELVEQFAHPQTNSQIYFLNGGVSFDDLEPIQQAIHTGRCFLFPIERFDESCVFLEKMFPQHFSDLSYVRANVSKKDATIDDEDREFVDQYLKRDYPVFELANSELDRCLANTFSAEELSEALADFQDRCSRRYHNFHPPRPRPQPPSEEPADESQGESEELDQRTESDNLEASPPNSEAHDESENLPTSGQAQNLESTSQDTTEETPAPNKNGNEIKTETVSADGQAEIPHVADSIATEPVIKTESEASTNSHPSVKPPAEPMHDGLSTPDVQDPSHQST